MTKIKVYLAGPIRGMQNLNLDEFRFVASLLEAKGYTVTVPHDLFEGIDTSGFKQEDYMAVCIPALKTHDVVCFLEGWKDSPGSKDEMEAAIDCAIKVVLAKNMFPEYAHRDAVLTSKIDAQL